MKYIFSPCLYRASMTIKTLYYPTDAQIYNYYKIFKIAPTCFGSQGILSRLCSKHTHQGKYAAITPIMSMSTDTVEPLLYF